MLEIRLNCEHCNIDLPNTSNQAMICTFECTFCKNCVDNVLKNVCPNCGGGFEKRPTRPNSSLKTYPASQKRILKPVTENKFLAKNQSIHPRKR